MEWGQARKKFLASWKRIQELCKEWEEINEASRYDASMLLIMLDYVFFQLSNSSAIVQSSECCELVLPQSYVKIF